MEAEHDLEEIMEQIERIGGKCARIALGEAAIEVVEKQSQVYKELNGQLTPEMRQYLQGYAHGLECALNILKRRGE